MLKRWARLGHARLGLGEIARLMMSTTEATTNHVTSISKPVRKNVVIDRVSPELAPAESPLPSPAVGPPQRAPSTTFLRLSAGTIYFFFGFLKFFPDLSPAEVLASQAVMRLTFGMLDAQMALFLLAIMDVCDRHLLFIQPLSEVVVSGVYLSSSRYVHPPFFISRNLLQVCSLRSDDGGAIHLEESDFCRRRMDDSVAGHEG